MDSHFLGRTGLQVSELCLGTMTFGGGTDEATAHRILDSFADAGGTFVDTADTYSSGVSEEMIGSWLKTKDRDELVIATKVYGEAAPGLPVRGAGRKHVMAAVEASLRRLGTDFIDLYQIHVWDDATPLEETLTTLDALVSSGKVRFIGASNLAGWQLQKAIDLSRHRGLEPYVCLQPLYNLLDRDAEFELIPVAQNEGAGVIAWSPLAGGWLSGKYTKELGGPPAGSRSSEADWESRSSDRTWRVIDTLLAVADETGRTPAQVALRWVMQRPGLTAPIIGVRTPEQLADNLGATGWALDDEQMRRLTEAGETPPPYPHNLLRMPQFRRRS
ncbi:aldo/keto reductase [Kribbella sp. ALI-6-A]|uniref:aldo/keto reductase n=1 Tax=Kribbella sp. ALI-6-A TaxID=1933817 RepID=UPI00097BC139|nr:aldo/keto reductase [Kribbella sp. ALI-6-A]ONI75617.1 aldo/keto reductase [Kribbella sp. ALI-6-A]